MFNVIINILATIIFITTIGTFIVLRPSFKSFTKSQKIWIIILVISTIIWFLMTNIPDFINGVRDGYEEGFNSYK